MTTRIGIAFLATFLLLDLVQSAFSDDGCCIRCGRTSCCDVVCVLKRKMKEVEVKCWGCKCEEFCVPGPSKLKCKHCETVCAERGGCQDGGCTAGRQPQAKPKKFVWFEWCPGCAKVHTRKRLMLKVVKKQVPIYTWEVRRVCRHCAGCCEGAEIIPGTEKSVPEPPVSGEILKYRKPVAAAAESRRQRAAR